MRVISKARLATFWSKQPRAEKSLRYWYAIVEAARWANIADMRATLRHADPVRVRSGNTLYVFNVGGNLYRIAAAVHFNTQRVYVLRVMTHKEYDGNNWKGTL